MRGMSRELCTLRVYASYSVLPLHFTFCLEETLYSILNLLKSFVYVLHMVREIRIDVTIS